MKTKDILQYFYDKLKIPLPNIIYVKSDKEAVDFLNILAEDGINEKYENVNSNVFNDIEKVYAYDQFVIVVRKANIKTRQCLTH